MSAEPNSLKARLAEAERPAPHRLRLRGVEFGMIELGGGAPPPDMLGLFKVPSDLEAYAEVLDGEALRNVFELGIFLGGSAALLTLLLEPDRLSCLDTGGRVGALEDFRANHPLGGRIRTHYRTSQDDAARLDAICREDFDGPLDLVIDDASHFYAPSRASFEMLFPRLRPRGWYVIEDWNWAHAPGFGLWRDQPALSNLIFEILMIAGAGPDLIARVEVREGLAFVQKGTVPASHDRLDLGSLYVTQGRAFKLL